MDLSPAPSVRPTVDLHRHLEGSLRLPTLWGFRQRFEPCGLSYDEFHAACTIPKHAAPGFLSFLARFNALRFCYGNIDNVERVADEAVADAAAEGIALLELRFSPVFFARRLLKGEAAERPLDSVALAEEAALAVVSGARRRAAACAIRVNFIVTVSRHFGAVVNRPALDLLNRPVGRELCALDLAGDESCDARDFVPHFRAWKEAGKKITIHAGEDRRIPGAESVCAALDVFGADRIGHGARAIEDAGLMRRLAETGVALELCPTSNLQTRAVDSPAAHPLKRFLEAGIRATINTDDPSISQTTLPAEYALAERELGLNAEDLKLCARYAEACAF
jgi:adenosine deaminase